MSALALLANPIVRFGLIALAVMAAFFGYGYSQRLEERHKWQATLATYTAETKAANDLNDENIRLLKKQAAADVVAASGRIVLQDVEHTKIQTIIKERIGVYVPLAVDDRSIRYNAFPDGWVRLYNTPLAAELPAVPTGEPGDADAPTGLRSSTVLGIAAANNDKAVKRGQLLKEWQKWYVEKKQEYEDFVAKAPKQPAIPTSTADASKRKTLGLGLPNPFDKD